MTTAPVYKAAVLVAGAAALLGEATVQVSGAQIVGVAITIIGFLLASLVSLVAWFMSRQLDTIIKTQNEHTTNFADVHSTLAEQNTDLTVIKRDVGVLNEWKAEREEAHRQAQIAQVEKLEAALAARKRGA